MIVLTVSVVQIDDSVARQAKCVYISAGSELSIMSYRKGLSPKYLLSSLSEYAHPPFQFWKLASSLLSALRRAYMSIGRLLHAVARRTSIALSMIDDFSIVRSSIIRRPRNIRSFGRGEAIAFLPSSKAQSEALFSGALLFARRMRIEKILANIRITLSLEV